MAHSPHSAPTDRRTFRVGLAYATGAYLWWGMSPLYWRFIEEVPPAEMMGHRVLGCVAVLAVLLAATGRLGELRSVVADRKAFATLVASTVFIATNWFTFLWAIAEDRVLEVSLGYYVTPLLNVLLGVVFLGERLRRTQGVAVALAGVGVAILTFEAGTLPWVSVLIAVSFAGYGLLRKTVAAGPEVGLAVETTLMLPVVVGWFLWRGPLTGGVAAPAFAAADPGIQFLVALSGPVTLVSLVWFTHGARRLPLSTLGILQYLSPTGQFLLAVFVFDETFSPLHLTAFAFIWVGLALFTYDLRRHLAAGG